MKSHASLLASVLACVAITPHTSGQPSMVHIMAGDVNFESECVHGGETYQIPNPNQLATTPTSIQTLLFTANLHAIATAIDD